ncbi:MAG: hypothetical protein ACKO7Q_03510 [Actinomycetota bacterium]
MATTRNPRPSARYRKHRRDAAIRRRRIVLLLVLGASLTIAGVAIAWPKQPSAPVPGEPVAESAAIAEGDGDAVPAATDGAETEAAEAAAGGGDDAGAPPEAPTEILPDWEPSARAQAAIDTAQANGRPPQFVVVSFDGAADYRMYDRWLGVAEETGARFTFFVSGIYMLLPEHATTYQPPGGFEPGFSNLGGYAELAGPKSAAENLRDNVADFNRARALGHEIGSHYVSHICEQADAWTKDDWISEESQWETLMLDPTGTNELKRPLEPIYTREDFHGGRTPCLAGDKEAVYAAMAEMGREYDASQPGIFAVWPARQQGLWSFPLPTIDRVGSQYPVMAMDYNFYVNHGQAETQAQADEFEELTYKSYMNAINKLHAGNRAPFITGSHFANWNKGAYMDALERTVRDQCGRPEVACVNMITLARWLDEQDPADLERWGMGDFPGGPNEGASAGAATEPQAG